MSISDMQANPLLSMSGNPTLEKAGSRPVAPKAGASSPVGPGSDFNDFDKKPVGRSLGAKNVPKPSAPSRPRPDNQPRKVAAVTVPLNDLMGEILGDDFKARQSAMTAIAGKAPIPKSNWVLPRLSNICIASTKKITIKPVFNPLLVEYLGNRPGILDSIVMTVAPSEYDILHGSIHVLNKNRWEPLNKGNKYTSTSIPLAVGENKLLFRIQNDAGTTMYTVIIKRKAEFPRDPQLLDSEYYNALQNKDIPLIKDLYEFSSMYRVPVGPHLLVAAMAAIKDWDTKHPGGDEALSADWDGEGEPPANIDGEIEAAMYNDDAHSLLELLNKTKTPRKYVATKDVIKRGREALELMGGHFDEDVKPMSENEEMAPILENINDDLEAALNENDVDQMRLLLVKLKDGSYNFDINLAAQVQAKVLSAPTKAFMPKAGTLDSEFYAAIKKNDGMKILELLQKHTETGTPISPNLLIQAMDLLTLLEQQTAVNEAKAPRIKGMYVASEIVNMSDSSSFFDASDDQPMSLPGFSAAPTKFVPEVNNNTTEMSLSSTDSKPGSETTISMSITVDSSESTTSTSSTTTTTTDSNLSAGGVKEALSLARASINASLRKSVSKKGSIMAATITIPEGDSESKSDSNSGGDLDAALKSAEKNDSSTSKVDSVKRNFTVPKAKPRYAGEGPASEVFQVDGITK